MSTYPSLILSLLHGGHSGVIFVVLIIVARLIVARQILRVSALVRLLLQAENQFERFVFFKTITISRSKKTT